MARERKIVEVDHEIKRFRLCWKRRDGTSDEQHRAARWGKAEFLGMSRAYAKSLVEFMDREFPEYEHWTEEEDSDA